MVSSIIFTEKLREYLMPKNIDDNLPLGIILSFTKSIIIDPNLFDNLDDYEINKHQKFSVLIFYSFLTGRVERYLMNYSDHLKRYSDFLSKNTNFKREDKFIYQNKEYFIDHTEEYLHRYHIPTGNFQKTVDLRNFNTGVINSHFYIAFCHELFRDWVCEVVENGWMLTYKDPNMNLIRKLTSPNYDIIEDKDIKYPKSTGNMNLEELKVIDQDTKHKLTHVARIRTVVDILENYCKDGKYNKMIIYIPKTFEKSSGTTFLSNWVIQVNSLLKKNYPQGLLDFKKSLSFSTIENINDFSYRIRRYNYFMNKIIVKNQPYLNRNPFI